MRIPIATLIAYAGFVVGSTDVWGGRSNALELSLTRGLELTYVVNHYDHIPEFSKGDWQTKPYRHISGLLRIRVVEKEDGGDTHLLVEATVSSATKAQGGPIEQIPGLEDLPWRASGEFILQSDGTLVEPDSLNGPDAGTDRESMIVDIMRGIHVCVPGLPQIRKTEALHGPARWISVRGGSGLEMTSEKRDYGFVLTGVGPDRSVPTRMTAELVDGRIIEGQNVGWREGNQAYRTLLDVYLIGEKAAQENR